MKDFLKKHWWIFIVLLVLLFVFPLIINILFKKDSGVELFRAEWNAGEALSFYGVILASLVSAAGVFISIYYSNKKYREDIRNRVLPVFSITSLGSKISITYTNDNTKVAIAFDKNESDCYECDYNSAIILNRGKISIQNDFDKDEIINYCSDNKRCVPIRLQNIGNGPALFANCYLKNINDKKSNKEPLVTTHRTCIAMESFTVYFLIEDLFWEARNKKRYVFDVDYRDIYKNRYRQEEYFDFFIKKGKSQIQVSSSELQKIVCLA